MTEKNIQNLNEFLTDIETFTKTTLKECNSKNSYYPYLRKKNITNSSKSDYYEDFKELLKKCVDSFHKANLNSYSLGLLSAASQLAWVIRVQTFQKTNLENS